MHFTKHRVRKTTVEERFEPRNLESFDLVTQERYRLHLQRSLHTKIEENRVFRSRQELEPQAGKQRGPKLAMVTGRDRTESW
jgi:hypothetical protein